MNSESSSVYPKSEILKFPSDVRFFGRRQIEKVPILDVSVKSIETPSPTRMPTVTSAVLMTGPYDLKRKYAD